MVTKFKNKKHLEILLSLAALIDFSKKKENKDLFKIPSKISYCFVKNMNKLKSVEVLRDEVLEKIKEEFKSDENFDESKYQLDKDYAKSIDQKLSETISGSELYNNFLEDEVEIDYFNIKLSLNKSEEEGIYSLDSIDPEGRFDFTYVPNVLFETIISLN